eukprot:CAMPEP_0178984046 /NCGR_PEP_ID=MMETSP0795-20121207/1389_1 /TAXON_ID=88552 /ORGANISM="Amoebophrya sp., Strain Ameob2" /LENGTH=2636 /DNA_ID=CAMNT_0020674869 /DNA_START=245 /DNA_END=8155 /DNA_ORIENTATION=-
MLHSMILEGPAFLISVHLGILFSVSYVVAFLANVLDSPSATKSLLGEDTQIQIETRHVCALASVWRARSTLSDLVPHIVGSSGSSRGPSSPSASATSWSLESLFRKATGSDPSGVLGAASQNAAPWPLSPGTSALSSGTPGESRGTTSSGELLHDFPGGGSRSTDSFGSMGNNDNASSFFTSSSSVSTSPGQQVPPNTGAATHRFLLFNLTGLAPSLESLFNAPSPPTPESRAAALALVNHLERLQAQGEEANRRYSHQTHDAPVVVDYSDSPEHDGNGDSDSGEDSVDEHEGATQESVFFEFDDAEDAVSHFSNSGRHHVVVTPNQPNLEDLRTATNFYQINYQTAAAQVQPGLSNQGYRLHDYPQQQRYDCFLRDSTSSRYGGTSSRPAVDLCAAVCGVYLDLSTTGPGKTKNVNYPNPFQRPWFSLCHHVFHLVLAVWLLFLFARVEMARITRDQTSLDSYRYPVRKNLALFWGYVLLISFLRTLVLDQKYEQGAAGGRSSLNSEGAEVADIIPWDRWSWSTTSTSREGSSSGQESFKVLKEAAGVVSSSWAAASLNGSTAAKGFYSWLSTAAPGLLPWATAHRDDHSQTAGAGYLQDASEDEPALLTQQQASRSPEDDYKEAPTATSTSSSIPEDVAPPPPAGRVSSVLGGGWFRLFFAVVCVEVEQTGLLFLVITIAFITLVTVGFVLARVFQAVRGALVFLVRLVCFLCFKTELDAVTLVSQTADNKTDVCAICLCELHPEKELLDEDADLQCVPVRTVDERNADPKNWEWVARSLREGMALEYGLRDCDVLGKTGASSSEEDGDEDLDRLGDVMDDFQEVVPGASGTTVSLQKELLRGVKRQCRRLLSKSKKAVLRVVLGNGFGEGRGEDDGSCSGGGRSGPGMLLHKAKSSGILRQLLQREAARSGPTLQPDDPDHALPSRRWASHEDEDVRVNGEDVYAHLPHQHQTNYPSSTTPTHSQQLCHSPLSFLSKLRPRVLASFESHFFRRQNALLQLQSCGHKFHASCLEAHFHTQIGRRAKHRSSCPLCRSVNERQVWRSFGSGFNIAGAAVVVPGGGGGDVGEQVGGQEGEVGEHPFQGLRGGGGGSRRNANPRLQHASRVLVEFLRSLLEFLAAEIDFLYFGLLLYVFLIAFSTTILLEFFLYFVSCLTDLLRQFHVVLEHAYTPAHALVVDEEDDAVSAGGGAEVEDVVVDDGSSSFFDGGGSFNRGVDLQDASGEEVLHLGPLNKKGSVELPDNAAEREDGNKAEPKMETGGPRDVGGSTQTTRSGRDLEAKAEGGPVRRAPPSLGNDQVQIEEVNVEDIAMAALRHAHGRCSFSRSCGEAVDGVDAEQGLDGRAQPFDQDQDLDPSTSLGHAHRDHQPPPSIRSPSQGGGPQALIVEDLEDAVPLSSWGDEVGLQFAEAGVIPFSVPRFKGTVSRDETLEVQERRDGVGNQRQNHTAAGLMQTDEIPGGESSREPIDNYSTVDLEGVEEGVAAPALRCSSGADAATRVAVEDDGAAATVEVDDAEDKDPAPELKDKDAAGSSSRAPSAATSPEEDALENMKSPTRSVEDAPLQQPLRRLSSVMTARDFFALRGIAPSRKSSVKVGSSSSRQTSDVLATSGGAPAEARRGTTRNDESSKVARVLSYMVQRALRTLTPAAAAHILATVRGPRGPPALYQQSQSPPASYAASLMMTGSNRAASVSTGGSPPPASSWAELDLVLDELQLSAADADAEEDHVHHSNATAISSVQVAANGEIVTSRVDQSLGEPQHSAGAREGDRGAEVGEHLLRDFRAAVGLSLGEAASLPVADLLRLQQRVNFLHSSTVGHQEHYSDVGGESAYNVDHRSTSDQPQPQVGVGVGPPKNLNTSKSSSRLRTRDGGVKLWDLLVANFSKSQLFCLFLTPATFFLVLLLLYEYRSCIEFLLQKLAVLYLKFFGDRVEIRVSVSSPGPAVGFPNDPDQEHVAPGGVDVGGPSSDGSSPAGGGTTGTLQMPGAAGPAAAEFIPSAAISSSAGAGGAASTSSPDEFEFDSAPDDRMFDSEEEDSTFEGGGGGTGRGRYVTYVCCVTPVLHACCEGARVLYVYAFAPVTVFWKGVFLEACGETLELCAEEVLPWYFSRRRVKMLQNAWKKSRTRGVWSHLSEEAAGEVEAPARRDEDVEVVAGEGVAEVGRMTLLRAARMLREQEKEVLREQLLVQNEMDESEAGTSTCSSCASSLSTSAAPAKPGRINDVREDHVESVRRRQLASTFGKDWNFSNSYAASPEVLAQGESRRAAVRLRPHEDRDRVREEGENEDHTAKSLEDDRVQFLPYNYILPPLLHSPLRFLTAVITSCAFLVHYILCFQAVFCFKVLHIFWIKIVVVRFLLAVPMWLFSSNIGVMGALPRSWRRRSRGSAFEPAEVEYDESASEDETEAGDDVFVGGDEDVGTAVVASYLWTLLRKGAREPFRVHNLLPGRGGHGVRGTRSIVDAEKRNREGIIGNEEGRVDAETSDAGGVTAEGATRRSYLLQIAASFYGAVRQRLHFFVPRRFYSGSNNITSFTEILAQNNERVLLFPVGPPRSSPSPILNESAAPAASSSLQEVVLVRASAVALSLKRRCVLSLLLSYPLAYCMVRWYFVTHVIYLALLFFPLLFARGRGGAGGMDEL